MRARARTRQVLKEEDTVSMNHNLITHTHTHTHTLARSLARSLTHSLTQSLTHSRQVLNEEDTVSINHNWINAANVGWTWELLQEQVGSERGRKERREAER